MIYLIMLGFRRRPGCNRDDGFFVGLAPIRMMVPDMRLTVKP